MQYFIHPILHKASLGLLFQGQINLHCISPSVYLHFSNIIGLQVAVVALVTAGMLSEEFTLLIFKIFIYRRRLRMLN